MRLEEIAYCRGFALSNDAYCHVPPTYRTLLLPSAHVFAHDRLVDTALAVAPGGTWTFIAGIAIDVETGEGGLDRIAHRLLTGLTAGEDVLFDTLDNLSGRFVLVYGAADRVRVLNDACGVRTIFYSTGRHPVVASHHGLIADALDAGPSQLEVAKRTGLPLRHGYPGRASAVDGVVMLTPNCLLDLTSGEVHRYFPRSPAPRSRNVAEMTERVVADVRRQLHTVAHRYPSVAVSISAGLDTRFTLATARPYASSFEYFTYRTPGMASQAMDAATAHHIVRRLGLSHRLLDTAGVDDAAFATFNSLVDRNTYQRHLRKIAFLYWRHFSARPTLHLRSNLAEIGRTFYRRHRPRPPLKHPSDLTRLYQPALSGHQLAERAFAEFVETTRFDAIYDYDRYAMFYWEHRMGTWHSHVVIESDPAFDTHALLNCRRILQNLLSLPFQERRRGSVFRRAIAACWPELAQIPINPANWQSLYPEVDSNRRR